MNFRIIVVSWELAVIPNKVSSVVGEIWHAFTWSNQFKTFWVNILVNIHSIKECLIEQILSLDPGLMIPSRQQREMAANVSASGEPVALNQIDGHLLERESCKSCN